ncbi:hypothetical protein C7H19_24115 [Aphanothece hegewaldii CCALA 016]|uniref:DUF1257 domain-containing protein n=1 Tax=Aphanothece hegewaldii CCALA 016 TaxID=2107694 RepID=A0A2T1LQT2_9CHRO|nr:DUF1257 domain-containing protein [Aphanothece hegewaldii]PSF30015.1 hypothetical protein C7H19_24115 [Aphanothece hegewaldii CCALA 016]
MSHFTSIKTQFKDEAALRAALEAMNLNPQVHNTPTLLRNTWRTKDYAEIIVLREQLGCNADVGFRRTAERFTCSADDYELARSRYPQFRYNIMVEYQAAVAQQKGYQVVGRRTTTDGRVQLQLQTQQIRTRR